MTSLLQQGTNLLAIQVHNFGTSSSDMSAIPFLFAATSDTSVINPLLPSWFTPSTVAFTSHLPLISIQTNGQTIVDDPKIMADMQAFDRQDGLPNSLLDVPTSYNGKIAIEIRGHSSQMFPKKSYGFETQHPDGSNNNVSLLGLPSENDWVLHGPYSDKSLIRNVLLFEIARRTGWYASRTVLCELIIDNDYRGVYVLMEKVKRDDDRVDVDELLASDNSGDALTGGYIIRIDWPTSGTSYDWHSPVSWYQSTYLDLNYQYVYPDRETITLAQKDYIVNYVSGFELNLIGNTYSDPVNGFNKYIDISSFIDFFLLQEFSKNVDAYRLSSYMFKVRDSKGGKLFAGPLWDFNLAFGNVNYLTGWQPEGWVLYLPDEAAVVPFHLKRLREDPIFNAQIRCRWDDLRSGILSDNHVISMVDSLVECLGPAIARNFNRWNILNVQVWPNYYVGGTHSAEITYMKNFILNRLVWMDANLPGAGGNCASLLSGRIVVSEINYKSSQLADAGDWFEIFNSGSTSTDLSGWKIKDANNLNSFTIPQGTILLPGTYLVIACELQKFQNVFPEIVNVIGSTNWKLSEIDKIRLYDLYNWPVCEVSYRNDNGWPVGANGSGNTLELADPLADLNNPFNWFEGCPGGSPGGPYEYPCPELLTPIAGISVSEFYYDQMNEKITINAGLDGSAEIFLYASDGRLVLKKSVGKTSNNISLKGMQPGYYIAQFRSGHQSVSIPIVR
jgi:hypothetical protein